MTLLFFVLNFGRVKRLGGIVKNLLKQIVSANFLKAAVKKIFVLNFYFSAFSSYNVYNISINTDKFREATVYEMVSAK